MNRTSAEIDFDFILVEDNPLDHQLITYCIEQYNPPVSYLWLKDFPSAEEWFDQLIVNLSEGKPHLPDFILTDALLDNYSSLPLIQKVKGHSVLSQIPVILFSSASDPIVVLGQVDVEIDGIYEKSHDINLYFEMIAEIMEKWCKSPFEAAHFSKGN